MKTDVIKMDPLSPDLNQIIRCAKIIRSGGLVVFPTETVYGIAADFSNKDAIKRLREVKKRSDGKPFSIMIFQKGLVSNFTTYGDPRLYRLIDAFWPGPLTIVVPARDHNGTYGIRMPDHKIALALVQESQCAVAAPSANFEGAPPPTTCEEALRDLDGLVDIAIDGGKAKIGKGSTVVDICKGNPDILREGVITVDDINRVVNKKTILFVCTGNSCRSVMAQYLLKSELRGREDVEVLSAGTGVFLRSKASAETISVLQEEGIDATQHLSQPLNTLLLKKADLIIVMTRTHRMQVLERIPEVEKRVYLLKEFATRASDSFFEIDIPDPIGRPHYAYKECLATIKESIIKLVELI